MARSWTGFASRGSDSDHPDQVFQPAEVGDVAGVEIEAAGVRRGGDQQVCEPRPGMRAVAQRSRCHEAVTACGGSVERDGFERRLDLLESGLKDPTLNLNIRNR